MLINNVKLTMLRLTKKGLFSAGPLRNKRPAKATRR